MAEEKVLAKESTVLDDTNTLIELKKTQGDLIWSEVYLRGDRTNDYVGIYIIDGDPHRREWITYNPQYIAMFSQTITKKEEYPPRITRLFDVQNKRFMKGSQEELQMFYQMDSERESNRGESTK